ncbi:MAG: hypothetical protein H0X42_13550, partial [Solirubrobacterales bacterium]|nr:hypothetical protein [Solirubrobacterales bacterium]
PRTRPATAQPRLALVVGRTAGAVRQLPDSGLIVRMTRGRAWIGVLGVLLVGIVGLNVATLSFSASSGKIYEQISALEKENSVLSGRVDSRYSTGRIHAEGAALGLTTSTEVAPTVLEYSPKDVGIAAQRLAGAG